jgi:hypothetical protein
MSLKHGFNKIKPSLDVLPFPASRQLARGTRCPNCTAYLTILQPDPGLPERLIGACEGCKNWYLIDMLPDVSEGTMLRLPEVQVIRNLSRENPSDGLSLVDREQDDDSTGLGSIASDVVAGPDA